MVIDVSDHWAIPDDGLGALLDAAVEAFVMMEADGPIVGWNCAAEAMFGWSREEAVELISRSCCSRRTFVRVTARPSAVLWPAGLSG